MNMMLNMTFHSLPCHDVEVHVMDVKGKILLDTHESIVRTPVMDNNTNNDDNNKDKNLLPYPIIHNYGDETIPHPLVQQPEQQGGCNLAGQVKAYRVAGSFHIAMGRVASGSNENNNNQLHPDGSRRHVHTFEPGDRPGFLISHTIHWLALVDSTDGSDENEDVISVIREHSGIGKDGHIKNGALNGQSLSVNPFNGTTGLMRYFLTIIPIQKKDIHGRYRESNRYIVNHTEFIPLYNYSTTPENEGGSSPQGQQQLQQAQNNNNNSSPVRPNPIFPGVFVIWDMNRSSELHQVQSSSWWDLSTIWQWILYTGISLTCLLVLDEVFFGARQRLMEQQRTRGRLLMIV